MELNDSLLSDNLRTVDFAKAREASLRKQTAEYVKNVIPSNVPATVKPATPKVERKAKGKGYPHKVTAFIMDGGTQERVIVLAENKRGQAQFGTRIHPHTAKPIRNNVQLSSRNMPTLVAGETILDADVHPSPDAYDNGYEERMQADRNRIRATRRAMKQASTGTRNVSGFSYRIAGHHANGKAF